MPNIYLLIGSDSNIIENNIREILSKIDYDNNNKMIYNLKDNNILDVIEEANTLSLIPSKKVILVYNCDILFTNQDEELIKYLNNYNKDVYILFITEKSDSRKKIYKEFEKNGKIINILDNDNYPYEFIRKYLTDNNYKMNNHLIEYFLSRTKNNINNIKNELDKLFLYKIGKKEITKDDIDKLTYNNEDNIMYEFTNAILEKDNNKAISMYHSFLEDNTNIDYLLVSIYNSYKTLYQVKILNKDKSIADIAKIIGKKEYFVKKTLERSMDYTEGELLDIIKCLSSIDRDYKKGLIDPVNTLEIFIVNKNVN